MSAVEHTPGPWDVMSVSATTGNISVGHRDKRIVIADVTNAASLGDMLFGAMQRGGGGFAPDDCHTQFANARLIAAAPDLLEALYRLKTEAEIAGLADKAGWDAWISMANEAIAKADPARQRALSQADRGDGR